MASLAVRLTFATTTHVFGVCHDLEVIGIAAVSPRAGVVERHVIGD
jgi:hypothetical protein